MKNKERYCQRRNDLKEFSKIAKLEINTDDTINDKVKALFYADEVLNTFDQWKDQGFKVKKGATAVALWGRPRRAKQDDTGDEYQYWPIVNLFKRSDVEPIDTLEEYEETAA